MQESMKYSGQNAESSGSPPEWTRKHIEIMQDAVERMEKHLPFASAGLIKEKKNLFDVKAGMTGIRRPPSDIGVVLRVFDGASFHEWSHNGLTNNALPGFAENFARDIASRRDSSKSIILPEEEPLTMHFSSKPVINPFDVPQSEKMELLKGIYASWHERDPRIRSCSTSIDEKNTFKIYVSSKRCLTQEVVIVNGMVMFFTANDKGRTSWDYLHFSTDDFKELIFDEARIESTMSRTLRFLDARPIPPGTYEVVTDPDVSGIIAHEAFGHGVETDMFVKDRARAREYMGKRVGSDLVDMYDDPTLKGRAGSYFFDDEGQVSTSTRILDKGILKSGLTDMYSASVLGIPRTANGRRQDVTRKVYARMSNTFFAPGESDKDDLISSVKHGYLLTGSGQGMEDPKEWGIQVESRFAEEIENGKLTGKLYSNIAITGTVPGILSAVKGVSKDLQLIGGGGCGKGHKEMVKVSCGGPYMLTEARLG